MQWRIGRKIILKQHVSRKQIFDTHNCNELCTHLFLFILQPVSQADLALEIASESLKLKLLKAECLALIGRSEVCMRKSNDMLDQFSL